MTPISLPGHTFHFQSVYDNLSHKHVLWLDKGTSTLPKLKAIAFKIVRWRPNSTFPNKHVKLYTTDHQDDVHYVPQFFKEEEKLRDGGVGVQSSNQFTNRTLLSSFCWLSQHARGFDIIQLVILHQLLQTILHMDHFKRIFRHSSSGWSALVKVKVLMWFCSLNCK